MDDGALTNPLVRAAVAALQEGNTQACSALFEQDALLCDDGQPRSLRQFTSDALGCEH